MKHPIEGKRFGYLVALSVVGESKRRVPLWSAQCDCGTATVARQDNLLYGNTTSCGCRKREASKTHGGSYLPEYRIWKDAVRRCENPGDKAFSYYGGRGIKVCEQWLNGFEAFFADMGPRPSPKYTLDRRNNDGPYSPDNCRWATRKEQSRNTSRNRIVETGGKKMSLAEAVESLDLNYATVLSRLRRGKSDTEALR